MENKLECIYLSEDELIDLGVLDMKACIDVMEEAFKLVGIGDYIMGGPRENEHGQKLYFPLEERFPNMPTATAERRFMSMIAYLGGKFNVTGMKWYGSNIENQKKGLPRSILLTILNDPDTGAPLSIMSANTISAMRTGAMPGLGSKYLADPNGKILGIVGAGVIGKTSLLSILETSPNIVEVKVYDVFKEKALSLSAEMEQKYGIKFTATDNMEDAIIDSDIINVAASRTNKPFIKAEWIKKGALLSLPAAVDLDEELLLNANIVVDEWKMHLAHQRESFELDKDDPRKFDLATAHLFRLIEEDKLEEKSIISLGSIVANNDTSALLDKDITIFITGGLPIQDVAWSYHLYKKAVERNVGQKLKLWDQPVLI
jgi:ornithine cyclodeaminase